MRNMKKQADQGAEIVRRRPALDLSAGDLLQLYNLSKAEDPLAAICAAYLAGLASGIRNARPTDPENIYNTNKALDFKFD